MDEPVQNAGTDKEILQGFRRDQEPLIRERVTVLLMLGLVLVPLFGWVDYVLYHDLFARFMVYRSTAAVICLMLNVINRKLDLRQNSFYIGITGTYVVAVTLIIMILETGGYGTPYYAGLNLVFLAFCTVLPVRVSHLGIHTAIIYLAYVLSVLILSEPGNENLFLSNNMFVVSTVVIALVVAKVGYEFRLREYRVRLDLQRVQEKLRAYSRNLEHTVTESEEKYQVLVENAHDGIFVIQDGHVGFPNPRALDLLGHSEDALSRIPFIDLVQEEDRDLIRAKLRETSNGKEVVFVTPFRIIQGAGEGIWVDMNLVPIDWKGRPGCLSFLRDVTERKRMEVELIQAQKMEAIGTLAGGIAHDFNNILTAILGYTELAHLQLPEDHPACQSLSQVLKASNRAKNLVAQILTFSRQRQHERKDFQMLPMIEETLGFIEAILPATVELRRGRMDETVMVYGDPTQINQVFMNLLTNAIHAMRDEGGTLEVSLTKGTLPSNELSVDSLIALERCAVLSVRDTGHGMETDLLGRIFDPFFTTKSLGEGTGMGLSVAMGIVKSHGGTIRVTSEPGRGSTFEVFLPLLERSLAEKREDFAESPRGHERILFVDDDEALIQFGEGILQHLGYQVLTRNGSMEALEAFKFSPDGFDLVITDQTMPKMTGIKLAEELLRIRPDLPIILCTGYSVQAGEEAARHAGIRKFLLKPYTIKDLAEAVREALDSKESEAVAL